MYLISANKQKNKQQTNRAFERQEPSSISYTPENKPSLKQRLDKLEEDVRAELRRQGFEGRRVQIERMLNMRFDGTDTALMVLPDKVEKKNGNAEGNDGDDEDFLGSFRRTYREEFGFLLDTKNIIVDDIKVKKFDYYFIIIITLIDASYANTKYL